MGGTRWTLSLQDEVSGKVECATGTPRLLGSRLYYFTRVGFPFVVTLRTLLLTFFQSFFVSKNLRELLKTSKFLQAYYIPYIKKKERLTINQKKYVVNVEIKGFVLKQSFDSLCIV